MSGNQSLYFLLVMIKQHSNRCHCCETVCQITDIYLISGWKNNTKQTEREREREREREWEQNRTTHTHTHKHINTNKRVIWYEIQIQKESIRKEKLTITQNVRLHIQKEGSKRIE